MKNKLLLIFALISVHLNAQREADCVVNGSCLRMFGWDCNAPYGNTILKFNADTLEAIYEDTILNLATYFSRAAFADRHTGDLLFASNGWRLVNGRGEILTHKLYFDFMSHPFDSFDTTMVNNPMGPLFLSDPGDSTKAYLFYGQLQSMQAGGLSFRGDRYFTYAYLDIPSQSMISKNNIIIDDTSNIGDMKAVRHANGRDWWLIKPHIYEDQFYLGLLSPQGIEMERITLPGLQHRVRVNTQSYFNFDGTKFIHFLNQNIKEVHVYDFDRCTGALNNRVIHDLSEYLYIGDPTKFSISASGKMFYFKRSGFSNLNPPQTAGVFQYDMETGITTFINDTASAPFLTPNGKHMLNSSVRFTANDSAIQTMSIITHPELAGTACNFIPHHYTVLNSQVMVYPSNYANFRLGKLEGSSCDTIGDTVGYATLKNPKLRLFPNPASSAIYLEFPYPSGKPYEIYITDALGKTMYRGMFDAEGGSLNLSELGLRSGLYVLQAQRDGKGYVKRFVME